MADQVEIGQVFAGHRIEAEAGRGGMGVVYVATHLALNRRVALKLIAPDLASDAGFRERFKQESMTAASIDHPNVISIFHAGEEDGKLYVTMRYVEGTDLRAMIARDGKIPPRQAAEIVSQVAAALDAAHQHGLVHRDVKPANILIGEAGHAYLTDFGLTKHAGSRSGLTKTGMFVGTLDYIAPEQLQGGPVDARVDVYALGCVLYQTLTGVVPFPRDTEPAKIWAHMQEEPPSMVASHPDVPGQFEQVVRRAMAKKPEDRYPSAGDLGRASLAAAEARDVATGERSVATGEAAPTQGQSMPPPVPATYIDAPPPGAPPAQKRRNLLPFAIAATVLIVIAAIVAVIASSGGGGDKSKTAIAPVASNPTPTATASTPSAPAAPDEGTKAKIQLALSTTLKAARSHNKLVFCGGLSLRYQNKTFGGPIECQSAAAKGKIPKAFTSASDASSSTTITGNRATVITVDGATFQMVKGRSFWEIDGVG
jgi:serine/threonine protein kinase